MRVLLTLALAASVVLTGCGGGESDKAKTAEKQLAASGAPTPVCIDKAKDEPLPASFPGDFPLPDGSKVYATQQRSGGRTIVYAVVDRDVKTVLQQLQADLPKAGFTPSEGEVEARDAESNWKGNGYTGRWAIREVAGCPEQTSVTVLSAKG
jgi:hypothetical protein